MVTRDAVRSGKMLYKNEKITSHDERTTNASAQQPGRRLYIITLLSLAFIFLVRYSFATRQQDNKACNMSYMYPSYRHLHGFDHEHTRFASKYSLYLYREVTLDLSNEPNGVPVLFVPGNAGSYKQVRPIAAESSAQFYEALKHDPEIAKLGKSSLDFFSVDFNEDFSAFHGQTMLDQAEYLNSAITYILSLYTDARKSPTFNALPDPTSVIIIGHSMGGLVARLTQIMPNYLPKSINTIITMSTPHAIPPAPFDPKIQSIYEDINAFWYNSFVGDTKNNSLQDVSLISIAGGGLDTIVSSDYTSTRFIVPDSNGFTVFTSTIPEVWISADHQAILWCDQFRKVIARALLECVDARRGTQTASIRDRMEILSKHFLSRLDRKQFKPTLANQQRNTITAAEHGTAEIYNRHSSTSLLKTSFSELVESIDLLPTKSGSGDLIQILTNIDPGVAINGAIFSVSLCRREGAHDWTMVSDQIPDLSCVDVTKDLTTLPSQRDLNPFGLEQRLYFLQYNASALSGHEFLALRTKTTQAGKFVAVEMVSRQAAEISISADMFSLFFGGFRLIQSASKALSSTIFVQGLVSSLIAYNVQIQPRGCTEELMPNVVRQHIPSPIESKYYVGTNQLEVSLHGQAPFFPSIHATQEGLLLQYWADPSCTAPLDLTLKVDYIGSLGKLVMRYRVVLVVYSFAMALLVVLVQLQTYHNTGAMMTFQQSLRLLTARALLILLGSVSVVSFAIAYRQARSHISWNEYYHPSTAQLAVNNYVMTRNDKFLGLQDSFLWWLAPLFLLVSIGALNIASLILEMAIKTLAAILDLVKGSSRIATETAERSFHRRILTAIVLLGFVSFLVPYQFAYIVACMVQFATCVRLTRSFDTKTTAKAYNFSFGLLVLMLCILPINIPILVVWVRNIAVQWFTPFSSHHNVLSVAPTILFVESLTNGRISAPLNNSSIIRLLGLAMALMACTSLLYGVMYTYMLHHILNSLAGLIFMSQYCASYSSTISSSSQSSSSSASSSASVPAKK